MRSRLTLNNNPAKEFHIRYDVNEIRGLRKLCQPPRIGYERVFSLHKDYGHRLIVVNHSGSIFVNFYVDPTQFEPVRGFRKALLSFLTTRNLKLATNIEWLS